jgi:CO dehydrogenase/acetyl-CoA synthase alpha subunit
MALKTTLEQIEEVQAAITQVMTSQSMEGPEGGLARARLAELTARETLLLDRYKSEQNTGGPRVNQGVPRRDY